MAVLPRKLWPDSMPAIVIRWTDKAVDHSTRAPHPLDPSGANHSTSSGVQKLPAQYPQSVRERLPMTGIHDLNALSAGGRPLLASSISYTAFSLFFRSRDTRQAERL
jgi:hypothetical protein